MRSCLMNCSQVGRIQVTAFQSQGGQHHTVTPLEGIDLESSWSSSDNALASHSIEGIEHDTGDSRFSKSNKVWLDIFTESISLQLPAACSILGYICIKTPFYLGYKCECDCIIEPSLHACLIDGEDLEPQMLLNCRGPSSRNLTRVHMCYVMFSLNFKITD